MYVPMSTEALQMSEGYPRPSLEKSTFILREVVEIISNMLERFRISNQISKEIFSALNLLLIFTVLLEHTVWLQQSSLAVLTCIEIPRTCSSNNYY